MRSFPTKVIKTGTEFWMRVPTDVLKELPAHESFSVKVHKAEPPYTVYVPTMETKVRRFGKDHGLTVPKALVTAGVLKHRMDVAVALVPRTV
jgi:antitoxin component of MazEF toxin-antitoxin module